VRESLIISGLVPINVITLSLIMTIGLEFRVQGLGV